MGLFVRKLFNMKIYHMKYSGHETLLIYVNYDKYYAISSRIAFNIPETVKDVEQLNTDATIWHDASYERGRDWMGHPVTPTVYMPLETLRYFTGDLVGFHWLLQPLQREGEGEGERGREVERERELDCVDINKGRENIFEKITGMGGGGEEMLQPYTKAVLKSDCLLLF